MKKIVLIILLSFLSFKGDLSAEVVAVFPQLVKPELMLMDDKQVYILQREHIYIYSRDGFKFIKKFGRKGEGPGEFMLESHFQMALGVHNDNIIVYSMGKISRFSKSGEFIDEKKLKSAQAYRMKPCEGFFVGGIQAPVDGKMHNSAILYDSDLNRVKVLKSVEAQFRGEGLGTHLLENQLVFGASRDKIFVSDCNPFVIDILDKKGRLLHTITKDVKQVPIPNKFKHKLKEFFKTDPRYKNIYQFLKPITCADYYPAIQEIYPDQDRLLVLTWQKKGSHYKCFIFKSDNGKFIKEVAVPLHFKANLIEPYPFLFKGNLFFQVVENQESELWELHSFTF